MPTPWPKAEVEEHSIAVQERRADMRAADAPEAEMNALFNYTKQFTEELFSETEHRDAIGAFEGANYEVRNLEVKPQQMERVWSLLVLWVPGVFLTLGLIVWWRRRH